jgi:hypothetical protein
MGGGSPPGRLAVKSEGPEGNEFLEGGFYAVALYMTMKEASDLMLR